MCVIVQEDTDEFRVLCVFLELSPQVTASSSASSSPLTSSTAQTRHAADGLQLSAASCVRWLCDSPSLQLATWCQQLLVFIQRNHHTARVSTTTQPARVSTTTQPARVCTTTQPARVSTTTQPTRVCTTTASPREYHHTARMSTTTHPREYHHTAGVSTTTHPREYRAAKPPHSPRGTVFTSMLCHCVGCVLSSRQVCVTVLAVCCLHFDIVSLCWLFTGFAINKSALVPPTAVASATPV